MPTYRITIYPHIGLTMKGDRWHPSHDLENVTYYFKKKAIEVLGQSMFQDIKVEMIDDDSKKDTV